MKSLLLSSIFFLLAISVGAQLRYFTKTGKIKFDSKAPLEDITAIHNSATCVLDASTGQVQFAVLMRGFEFRKALMQEHFNENYIESDKYPKSTFKGEILNNPEINYATPGQYTAQVKGVMTIHGVSKEVETTGTVMVEDGKLLVNAKFPVKVADYQITIPSIMKEKIANTVTVSVRCELLPMK